MNIRWAAMLLLGAIGTGRVNAEKIDVQIYIQKDNWDQPMKAAEVLVSELFERRDIRVRWHSGELPASPGAGRWCIGIRMVAHAPASVSPNALASARPFGSSGSLISVYQDRIERHLKSHPIMSPVYLGYIFAHELAHVMEGYDYHSDSGIMKAHWSNADHAAMRANRLAFTDEDSDRIHGGLSARLAYR